MKLFQRFGKGNHSTLRMFDDMDLMQKPYQAGSQRQKRPLLYHCKNDDAGNQRIGGKANAGQRQHAGIAGKKIQPSEKKGEHKKQTDDRFKDDKLDAEYTGAGTHRHAILFHIDDLYRLPAGGKRRQSAVIDANDSVFDGLSKFKIRMDKPHNSMDGRSFQKKVDDTSANGGQDPADVKRPNGGKEIRNAGVQKTNDYDDANGQSNVQQI